MRITLEFLKKHNACKNGLIFVQEKGLIGMDHEEIIQKLIDYNDEIGNRFNHLPPNPFIYRNYEWPVWLIYHILIDLRIPKIICDNFFYNSYCGIGYSSSISIYNNKLRKIIREKEKELKRK
jgi:hypothetical protein